MPDKIKDDDKGIVTGYNQQIVQQALGFANRGIGAQRQAMQQSIGGIESSLFDQMGRQQLQTERDIAQRRMQALRSGMPSSQLAALELQNIQTAQLGAQQMAKEYDQLRMDMETQLAGAEDMAAFEMFQTMAQGRTDSAAIEGQKFASDIMAQFKEALGEDFIDSIGTDDLGRLMLNLFQIPEDQQGPILDAFRAAARGMAPPKEPKEEFSPFTDSVSNVNKDTLVSSFTQFGFNENDIRDTRVIGQSATIEDIKAITGNMAGLGKEGNQDRYINSILNDLDTFEKGTMINMNIGLGNSWFMVTEQGLVSVPTKQYKTMSTLGNGTTIDAGSDGVRRVHRQNRN